MRLSGSLHVLLDEEIRMIHEASLEILGKVGVEVRHRGMLHRFEEGGAVVDRKKWRVRIPRDMVENSLNGVKPLRTNGEFCFVASGYNQEVVDLETRRRRPATLKDLADCTRVADALENIDTISALLYPRDVPPQVSDIYMWFTLWRNTSRPERPDISGVIKGVVHSRESGEVIIGMAETIVGGIEKLRRTPIVSLDAEPLSPLCYEEDVLDKFLLFAEKGLPVCFESMPIMCMSAPATIAGTLVIQNCEQLTGVVMKKLVNPEVPDTYNTAASPMDPHSGSVCYGSPEKILLVLGGLELANHYGIPAEAHVFKTDAKKPGLQAGVEKALSTIPAICMGAAGTGGAGILSIDRVSLVQLVLDNEIVGMIRRLLRGIEFSEELLGLESIKRLGPKGFFLKEPLTRKRQRKEYWFSQLFDRDFPSSWERKGGKGAIENAEKKAREILKEHHSEPLGKDIIKELEKIIQEAEKKLLKKNI